MSSGDIYSPHRRRLLRCLFWLKWRPLYVGKKVYVRCREEKRHGAKNNTRADSRGLFVYPFLDRRGGYNLLVAILAYGSIFPHIWSLQKTKTYHSRVLSIYKPTQWKYTNHVTYLKGRFSFQAGMDNGALAWMQRL